MPIDKDIIIICHSRAGGNPLHYYLPLEFSRDLIILQIFKILYNINIPKLRRIIIVKEEDKFEDGQTKPPCDGFSEKCQSCPGPCSETTTPDDVKK
jgi:hypothetical protein